MTKQIGTTLVLKTNNSIYIIIICILLIIIISGIILYFTSFAKIPKIIQNVSIKNERQPLDQFYNIYSPPLRNNSYISQFNNNSYELKEFTQIGILKYQSNNNDADFLPLFGRPLSTSRNQWQYYTLSNSGSIPGIKLNLRNEKGRNLMNDTGSPELYDNDTVITDGYDKSMMVSLYKEKNLYYI